MMTIYRFRIQLQDTFPHSPITIQILKRQDQSFAFANLMDKLRQSLPNKICLSGYYIFIGNDIRTKIELINDHTLKHALSILRLNKLEIFLHHKKSSNANHAPIHYNTVPVIKPKVIRWDQYKYRDHDDSTKQQRKDSGIELESHLFPNPTSIYDSYIKGPDYYNSDNNNNSSKRPSLDMLLSSNNDDEEDLPGISHSVDSSPSASPSTIASSSPSSPVITYSNSDITATPRMKSSKKYKGSPWSSTNHPSSPSASSVYFCEKVMDSGKTCGQTFQRPYDLARHQTIHLKNRPFVYCQQCGKRFTRVDALRRHERVQGHYQSQKHNRNYHPHHQHHHHKVQHIHHHHHHPPQSISVYPI